MVNYLVIVLIVVTWCGVARSSDINEKLNVDLCGQTEKICDKDIKVREGGRATVIFFSSKRNISTVYCTNAREKIDYISFGIKMAAAIFYGEDSYEGEWKCNFTTDVKTDVVEMFDGEYDYGTCRISVEIRHDVQLTVTSLESKGIVQARRHDLTYYYFTPNERVHVECSKDTVNKNSKLLSGSLKTKLCYNGGAVCPEKHETGIATIKYFMNMTANLTDSELFCVYTSKHNETFAARIVFRQKSLPDISINKKTTETPPPLTAPNTIQKENYERNQTLSDVSYHGNAYWLYILIIVGCGVFVGAVVCLMLKLKRRKTEYTEHLYATVIYDTRDQERSTPPLEADPTFRPNPVSRDSAKYVTMTPGETPSVAHYLLPTQLKTTEPIKQLGLQVSTDTQVTNEFDRYLTMKPSNLSTVPAVAEFEKTNVTSESERYINIMKPSDPAVVLSASAGFAKPNNHVSNESDRYLTMQPSSFSTATTTARDKTTSLLTSSSIGKPTSDGTREEIIYEDCNEFYPKHFDEEFTYEAI